MKLDLASPECPAELQADICIVGAGAAGLTIATALKASGLRICILESGGPGLDPRAQALGEGESTGHPFTLTEGRYRTIGGSTSHWTGRCAALDPLDFQVREWVRLSGWPIDGRDLAPFEESAQRMCGFAEPWSEAGEAMTESGLLPRLAEGDATPFLWRFAVDGTGDYTRWGPRYGPALADAPSVSLVTHATVTDLEHDGHGRVTRALARNSGSKTLSVSASAFVLCGGGIENARMLLDMRDKVRADMFSDFTGRCFMQHPRGVIATAATTRPEGRDLQGSFNIVRGRGAGRQYEVGLCLAPEAQARHGALNCSASVIYEADPNSGWESGKRFARELARGRASGASRALYGAVRDWPDFVNNFRRRVLRGVEPELGVATAHLLADFEEEPDPSSRVTLSEARDALGQRRARVDWRLGEACRTTAAVFADAAILALETAGYPRFEKAAWLSETGPIGAENLTGTYHHIGTTRMAASAATGVVDPECRVHGSENLYMSGCSVFPTGGHANPTYTIILLALRLAERLSRLRPGQ